MEFTREELWRIESKCQTALKYAVNPYWRKAFEDLEFAANVLDAHIARSSEGEGDK